MSPPGNFSFAGDWQCSGQFVQSGRVHRSSWHGSLSADGKWIELTEIDVEPAGYSGHYQLAVDADRTSIVFLDTNSAGYAIFKSPGWDGRTLTLTSTDVASYAAPPPKNRFLYTIVDPQHFDVEWQTEKSGAWTSSDLQHCSQDSRAGANYFVPGVHVDDVYKTVFSRTISIKGDGIDEFVRRVGGTASTTVTGVAPGDIKASVAYRYDGLQEGRQDVETKDFGRTNCYDGKCQPQTDASGAFFNTLLWGTPPRVLQPGVSWHFRIEVPWELGTAGEQTVTVLSMDPSTGTILVKREGSGEGFFADDHKQRSITSAGRTYSVDVAPGRSHWIGQTVFRRGVVISDELMTERPVVLSAPGLKTINANERQYILLNAAP